MLRNARFSIALALVLTAAASAQEPRQASKTVHNENFVVSAPTEQLATTVFQRAEKLRDEIALEWLGQKLPPSIGPTVIYVRITDTEDHGRTWPSDDPSKPSFMMWLTTTEEKAVGSLLAHEMTHVVLSTRFPGQFPPWANEGIATLRDDDEFKKSREEILQWYAQTGNWPFVGNVLDSEKLHGLDRAGYAVANSLVTYLLARRDRATLLNFAVSGKHHGWDASLRQFYNIENVGTLQRQWQAWATNQLAKRNAPATGTFADGRTTRQIR